MEEKTSTLEGKKKIPAAFFYVPSNFTNSNMHHQNRNEEFSCSLKLKWELSAIISWYCQVLTKTSFFRKKLLPQFVREFISRPPEREKWINIWCNIFLYLNEKTRKKTSLNNGIKRKHIFRPEAKWHNKFVKLCLWWQPRTELECGKGFVESERVIEAWWWSIHFKLVPFRQLSRFTDDNSKIQFDKRLNNLQFKIRFTSII